MQVKCSTEATTNTFPSHHAHGRSVNPSREALGMQVPRRGRPYKNARLERDAEQRLDLEHIFEVIFILQVFHTFCTTSSPQ